MAISFSTRLHNAAVDAKYTIKENVSKLTKPMRAELRKALSSSGKKLGEFERQLSSIILYSKVKSPSKSRYFTTNDLLSQAKPSWKRGSISTERASDKEPMIGYWGAREEE